MHLCTTTVVMIEHIFLPSPLILSDMSQIEVKQHRNLKQTTNPMKKHKEKFRK